MSKPLSVRMHEEVSNGIGFIQLFQSLTTMYNDAISDLGNKVDCPWPHNHREGGGKNDFRFVEDFDASGFAICSCTTRWTGAWDLLLKTERFSSFSDMIHTVQKVVEGGSVMREETNNSRSKWPKGKPRKNVANTPRKIEGRRKRISELRLRSTPLNDSQLNAGIKYISETRGLPLSAVSNTIRFVDSLGLYQRVSGKSEHVGNFPCILAEMCRPDGQFLTFHRIFVTEEGLKAPAKEPKLLMPEPTKGEHLMGSAIRINENASSNKYDVIEGVEKGICINAFQDGRTNVWAGYSGAQVAAIRGIPQDARVRIWVDRDPISSDGKGGSGLKNAYALYARLKAEGIDVYLIYPRDDIGPTKFDWEDIIIKRGLLMLTREERDYAIRKYVDTPALVPDIALLSKRVSA